MKSLLLCTVIFGGAALAMPPWCYVHPGICEYYGYKEEDPPYPAPYLGKGDTLTHAQLNSCLHVGQPCNKMRRAAEAAKDAITITQAIPDNIKDEWCYESNGPCAKAKRDALALADAVAEAHLAADSDIANDLKQRTETAAKSLTKLEKRSQGYVGKVFEFSLFLDLFDTSRRHRWSKSETQWAQFLFSSWPALSELEELRRKDRRCPCRVS